MADRKQPSAGENAAQTKPVAFPGLTIFPGESRKEFDQLLDRLISDHKPDGALEDECILSIAAALWRKRRLSIFRRIELAFQTYGHQTLDQVASNTMRRSQEMLAKIQKDAEEFQKTGKKPKSVEELNDDVIKSLESLVGSISASSRATADKAAADLERDLSLARLAQAATPERFAAELEVVASLDAVIDRDLARLMKLQADRLKQAQAQEERRHLEQARRADDRQAIFRRAE